MTADQILTVMNIIESFLICLVTIVAIGIHFYLRRMAYGLEDLNKSMRTVASQISLFKGQVEEKLNGASDIDGLKHTIVDELQGIKQQMAQIEERLREIDKSVIEGNENR